MFLRIECWMVMVLSIISGAYKYIHIYISIKIIRNVKRNRYTAKRLGEHEPLKKIQSAVISLTTEISKLDDHLAKGRTPNHLQLDGIPNHLNVSRNLPKLPSCMSCSDEFKILWDCSPKGGQEVGACLAAGAVSADQEPM